MALKFRLKGLAETFVEKILCGKCGHDGGEDGDEGFKTDLTRVTFDGIVVVIQCSHCGHIFVPDGQRHGVLNPRKLRTAVEKDSITTGQPIFSTEADVKLDVEKLNAERTSDLH